MKQLLHQQSHLIPPQECQIVSRNAAGSGKTTLLTAWARTTALPVAWLSLEEADDDPLRFLSYLMAAFTHRSTWPEEKDATFPPLSGGSSWEEVLTPFLNDLARVLTSDTMLVLDDYHLMETPVLATWHIRSKKPQGERERLS